MSKLKLKRIVESIIREAPATTVFEPTKEGAVAFGEELKRGIKVPIFKYSVGSFGDSDTLYITCALQSKDKWTNGIFQNSIYFQMKIDYDGTMEVFSANLTEPSKNPQLAYQRIPVKFRKTKAKNAADAIAKINKFISEIKNYYKSTGNPLEESNRSAKE